MRKSLFHKSLIATALMVSAMPGDDGTPSLNLSYQSQDEIPEQYRGLYTEEDGSFKLTRVVGMKTQDDVNRLTEALNKERNDHKQVRSTLSRLGDQSIDDVLAALDRIPALEAAAKGADNIDEQIAGRLQQETAPLQRTINELTSQLEEAQGQVKEFQAKETRRTIGDAVGQAATKLKMLPEAVDDVAFMANGIFETNEAGQVVAKAGIQGVTPGISPEVWLTELKQTKPFYWPASQGAGGRGGKGGQSSNNPFTKDNWNLTEQGKLINSNRALAEQYASAAGTTIGGPRPA